MQFSRVKLCLNFLVFLNCPPILRRGLEHSNEKFCWWESETFAFVRLPKVILKNPSYKGLSKNAALLYEILLDHMSLLDKNRHDLPTVTTCVFVYYILKEICETLSCGHDKATKMLKELERYGLISCMQQGRGNPARIYVHKFQIKP